MGIKGLVPCLAMIFVQFCFAGMNIVTKLALDSGMNPLVMVTYRQIFATIALAPFAFLLEWKTLPRITRQIAFQMFLCSVLGATLNQCLYFIGLKHSTPTIACALNNLLPAITFILAVPFKMETIGIKSIAGQAKVVGTIVCVGGAMLMTFYNGKLIHFWRSGVHWSYAENMANNSSGNDGVSIMGPVFVMGSCVAWAAWFILQGKLSKSFRAPYTSTCMMCFMAIFECAIIGVFFEHNTQAWSLRSKVWLIGCIYNGVVGSAMTFYLMSWCVDKRGPLYASAFSPLLLVIVAVYGWALLEEKLYLGRGLAAILIVAGLYAVLWGKEKEMEVCVEKVGGKSVENEETVDVEMPPVHINGRFNNEQV